MTNHRFDDCFNHISFLFLLLTFSLNRFYFTKIRKITGNVIVGFENENSKTERRNGLVESWCLMLDFALVHVKTYS